VFGASRRLQPCKGDKRVGPVITDSRGQSRLVAVREASAEEAHTKTTCIGISIHKANGTRICIGITIESNLNRPHKPGPFLERKDNHESACEQPLVWVYRQGRAGRCAAGRPVAGR
jgi:hypothetical protein